MLTDSGLQAFFFDPQVIWLTPNDLVSFQLRKQLQTSAPANGETGAPGQPWKPAALLPRLLTINALENDLAGELPVAEADELERRLILYDLARPLAALLWPDLKPRPSDLKILADDLSDGLDRLKLAGLTWEQVAGLPPEPLGRLLADLGRRHDDLLAASKRLDRFARRRLVLERLRRGREFRALSGVREIVCAWSQRLSPFETDFILALAKGRQLKLTLKVPAWVRDEEISHSAGFDLMRSIRQIEQCDEPTLWLDFAEYSQETSAPALAYAADMLLAPTSYHFENPPDIDDQLTIVRTATAYHEVEDAARRIKENLAAGADPENLALVVPNPETYEPLIDDLGRRFGLAFHFRRGAPLLDQGPVRAVMKLLALWSSDWERSRVMDLVSSPYFSFDLDPVRARQVSLQAGVTDRRAGGGFEENLGKVPAWRSGSHDRRVAEELLAVINRLQSEGETLAAAPDWAEFINCFRNILTGHNWPGPLDQAPEAPVNVRGADLAAAGAFEEELEHLGQALTRAPNPPEVGLEAFILWLETVLAERRVSFDANPDGRVRVLNYYDLHGGCFDQIFFLGLNERVFPQTAADSRWWPEEFITAAASRDLLGRPLWNEAADRYRQEELMLAAGIGQARHKVWLYYHAGEESGRAALPSPLLTALKELWPDGRSGSRLPEINLGWTTAPPLEKAAGPDELLVGLMTTPPDRWPQEYQADLARRAFYDQVMARSLRWRAMRGEARPGPAGVEYWLTRRPGYRNRPLIRPAFLANMADCPLAFWLGEALALGGDGEALEEWPASSEGTLIHKVLERFFKKRLEQPWPGGESFESAQSELLRILDQTAAGFSAENPLGRLPLWHIRRKRLKDFLSGWLKREMTQESVRPLRLEWSFDADDKEGVAPPFELAVSETESIFFKGRVDRLDQTETGLAVRDYKRRDRPSYHLKKNDQTIPTPIWPILTYALAAAEAFNQPVLGWFDIIDPAAKSSRVMTLNTGRPEMTPPVPAADDYPAGANFRALLAETWSRLKTGVYPPLGDETTTCVYCQFTLLCPRFDQGEAEDES